jgi:hypothetical protein
MLSHYNPVTALILTLAVQLTPKDILKYGGGT